MTPKNPPTQRQQRVLEVFRQHAEAGFPPPTLRELCQEFGWRSTGTARDHLRALQHKGLLIPAARKSRGTRLALAPRSAQSVPIVGHVAAGRPILVEENFEGEISVPSHLLARGRVFVLRVVGDSMEGAGILDRDLVVVRESRSADPGKIVAATIRGETTLKRLVRKSGSLWLAPENPKYSAIKIDGEEVLLHGVVTGLMRSYEPVRSSANLY